MEEEKEIEKEEKEEIKKKSNKKIIIIVSIIIGIIIIIGVVFLLNNSPKKGKSGSSKDNTKEEETDPDLVEDTRKRIPRTENKMTIYLVNGEFIEDSYCDDTCKKSAKANAQIDIEKQDAKLLDYSPKMEYKDSFPDYFLYQDGDKIKYFNVSNFTSQTSGLKPDYIKYKIIENNKNLEAIYFKKKGEKGIYSIISKKSMYVNKYDSFESLIAGLVNGKKDDKSHALSLVEEKEIDNVDIEMLSKLNKKEEFYVMTQTENNEEYYTIYSTTYNKIVDKINANLTYFEKDIVYYIKDKKVYGYDNKGNKKYENKVKNEDVVMVLKGYYVSMNNNKFELRDLEKEDRALFDELPNYHIDYFHSGYKDKGSFTNITGDGIYLVFIKTGTGKETIVEEYFNPTTKETKKETIEK